MFKKISLAISFMMVSLLLLTPTMNAYDNINGINEEIIKTIKIDDEITIQKNQDGTVNKIENASLTDNQQRSILKEMNFTEEEIEEMNPSQKEELATNGGVKVDSETKLVQYFNSMSGIKYLVTDENRAEIEALRQLEANELSKQTGKEIQIGPLVNAGSVKDGIFSAKGSVIYQGKSANAKEFQYRYHDSFRWAGTPKITHTDTIAHAWQSHSTSYAKGGNTTTTVVGNAKNFETLTVTNEGVYGSAAKIKFNTLFQEKTGYIYNDVRIPVSNKGNTGKFVAKYAHPWTVLQPSLTIGPVGVSFGGFVGDEWQWETTYTITSDPNGL
ncbi:hypothetical protein [Paenibacillus xylanexedens]|uniref:hypothetical protein n=1 Tax=Paenibacillus xylanexedens TaxID=528191 RepID=UPI0011A18052|nr:hypothetical protein [Paenibacillus xylanexedens]